MATSYTGQPPPPQPAQTYRRSRLRLEVDRTVTVAHADAVTVLRAELMGEAQEVILIAALDGLRKVADVVEVARGGYHSVGLSLPPLLAVPILAGCDRAVIAHTHPSGRLIPSDHDYELTREVAVALGHCGIELVDHLIFGPDGKHLSLREAHVLEVPEPTKLEVQS